MRRWLCLAALAAIAGCAGVERYPISHQLAEPGDPVHQLDALSIPDIPAFE